jgi:hypothetical protein
MSRPVHRAFLATVIAHYIAHPARVYVPAAVAGLLTLNLNGWDAIDRLV